MTALLITCLYLITSVIVSVIWLFLDHIWIPVYGFRLFQINCLLEFWPYLSKLSLLCFLVHFHVFKVITALINCL